MSRIRCLVFVACVLVVASSLLKIVDVHTIQTRPNATQIITMQHTNISMNILQRFVLSQEWSTIFKGRKMNRSCLCACFATLRLLLNVSHVILERFTIIARFISFNLQWFAISIYTLYKHLCFRPQLTMDTSETGGIYTPSDSHDNSYHGTHDRTCASRPIALARVQSFDHLITRATVSHYLTTLASILQQSYI